MIILIKVLIFIALFFLIPLFFKRLEKTIAQYKKDTEICKHYWVYRSIKSGKFKTGYYVCQKCRNLKDTEYYEEIK